MIEHRDPSRWKPIPSFPGYEASDYGTIFNTRTGRELVGTIDRYGYRYVNLWIGPKMVKGRVHRMVCEAWHGSPSTAELHAAHLNGNTQDNRAINLRWKTPKENEADKLAHGTWQSCEKHPSARLTPEQIEAIRADPRSSRAIAREYGVAQPHIVRIRNGTAWGQRHRPTPNPHKEGITQWN